MTAFLVCVATFAVGFLIGLARGYTKGIRRSAVVVSLLSIHMAKQGINLASELEEMNAELTRLRLVSK